MWTKTDFQMHANNKNTLKKGKQLHAVCIYLQSINPIYLFTEITSKQLLLPKMNEQRKKEFWPLFWEFVDKEYKGARLNSEKRRDQKQKLVLLRCILLLHLILKDS